jgi:hypothetical protein
MVNVVPVASLNVDQISLGDLFALGVVTTRNFGIYFDTDGQGD